MNSQHEAGLSLTVGAGSFGRELRAINQVLLLKGPTARPEFTVGDLAAAKCLALAYHMVGVQDARDVAHRADGLARELNGAPDLRLAPMHAPVSVDPGFTAVADTSEPRVPRRDVGHETSPVTVDPRAFHSARGFPS